MMCGIEAHALPIWRESCITAALSSSGSPALVGGATGQGRLAEHRPFPDRQNSHAVDYSLEVTYGGLWSWRS
jgi:hypothetical protein